MTPGLSMRNLQGMNAQAWLERATRTLPTAISVLAVVAIAWQLAQLTWLIWGRLHPAAASVPVMQPSAQPAARPAVNVQSIVDAHLFGVPNAAVPEDNGANAQPTQLPLVLAATLAGPEPTKGFAIIGDSA